MKNMRDLIALTEGEIVEAGGNALGEPLEGWGSSNGKLIMDMLPDIDNEEYFARGWRKVMQNNEEQLNRWELEQMGKAFVNIIRMDPQSTYRIMRRLMIVHTDKPGEASNVRDVNGTTPGLADL